MARMIKNRAIVNPGPNPKRIPPIIPVPSPIPNTNVIPKSNPLLGEMYIARAPNAIRKGTKRARMRKNEKNFGSLSMLEKAIVEKHPVRIPIIKCPLNKDDFFILLKLSKNKSKINA